MEDPRLTITCIKCFTHRSKLYTPRDYCVNQYIAAYCTLKEAPAVEHY